MGHLGMDKTEQRVRERFFWLSLRDDVRKYIRECTSCQRLKNTCPGRVGPLMPILPTTADAITCMDFAGPLPATARGNIGVRACVRHFTGFTSFYAVKSQTARSHAETLVADGFRYGFSRAILTDQGVDFQAEMIDHIYDLLDIQRLKTSPYHPMTDGKAEEKIKEMKLMLIPWLNEHQNDWDLYLDHVAFAINTAVNVTTGHTPWELMFGMKPRIPIDLFYEALDIEQQQEIEEERSNSNEASPTALDLRVGLETEIYAQELKNRMQEAFKLVSTNRRLKMDRKKIEYDRNVRSGNFKVGDLETQRNVHYL
jgi:hypothetical protein